MDILAEVAVRFVKGVAFATLIWLIAVYLVFGALRRWS